MSAYVEVVPLDSHSRRQIDLFGLLPSNNSDSLDDLSLSPNWHEFTGWKVPLTSGAVGNETCCLWRLHLEQQLHQYCQNNDIAPEI